MKTGHCVLCCYNLYKPICNFVYKFYRCWLEKDGMERWDKTKQPILLKYLNIMLEIKDIRSFIVSHVFKQYNISSIAFARTIIIKIV